MDTNNEPKCSECGKKLTTYEISDNLYVGIEEKSYICYNCQAPISDTDDEYFDEYL